MNKPNFINFFNEEGTYTIVYDVNGEHETIVGAVGSQRLADETCKQLNNVLFRERENIKQIAHASYQKGFSREMGNRNEDFEEYYNEKVKDDSVKQMAVFREIDVIAENDFRQFDGIHKETRLEYCNICGFGIGASLYTCPKCQRELAENNGKIIPK